jgi:hypothetical protein
MDLKFIMADFLINSDKKNIVIHENLRWRRNFGKHLFSDHQGFWPTGVKMFKWTFLVLLRFFKIFEKKED